MQNPPSWRGSESDHSCGVFSKCDGHFIEGAPAGPFFLWAGGRSPETPPELIFRGRVPPKNEKTLGRSVKKCKTDTFFHQFHHDTCIWGHNSHKNPPQVGGGGPLFFFLFIYFKVRAPPPPPPLGENAILEP